jgi:hypothetical protein
MHAMTRQALAALITLLFATSGWSCSAPAKSCLGGERGCEAAPLCEGLQFSCEAAPLYVGTLADLPGGLDLQDAEGTGVDYVLQNGQVTVVIDALAEPHSLAPTGGNIIDMGGRGGADDLNLIYQISGILPDDAFAYTSLEVIDHAPEMVAIVVRGTMDGRSEVKVVTRYELHACEPGVRVRSEIYNGSPDPHAFTISDTSHWGKRNALPFAPLAGQGFVQPSFELLDLQEEFLKFDYVLARAAEAEAPSYAFVACDRDHLQGVNSTELSALGTSVELLRPGHERSYQRFILATQSPDLSLASSLVDELRRQLHGERASVHLQGQVVAEGLPLAGSLRRATIVISEVLENGSLRPLSTIMPDAQGQFEVEIATSEPLRYELWSFGRVVVSAAVPPGSQADLGQIEIEMPGRLGLSVTGDNLPIYGSLFVLPADEAEEERLRGDWLGEFYECSPWLGPPVGGSPACNVVNLVPQGTDFELPAGRYQLWFTAGPEWTLARVDIEVRAGEYVGFGVNLQSLEVAPPGWLSSDLHVHGKASFDSSLPDRDRVQSIVAHGIDVVASTDHDFVTDYSDALRELGLDGQTVVIGGLESTQLIPHMKVPGSDLPKVIGHFNHWPLSVDATAPRGGAPWDEKMEAAELFDRVRPLMGPEGIHMLNHPWDERQFGRDLGFLRAIGFDPRQPIPPEEDGSANGVLQRASEAGTRNIDFNLIEVQNGSGATQVIKTRGLWFALLSQGYIRAGVGNSDSHELDERLGFARTYVDAGITPGNFDVATFNRALKEGKAVAGNGVVVMMSVGQAGGTRRGLGLSPYQPAPGDTLEIEVRAPPWIPVDEVKVVSAMGEVIVAAAADVLVPADPMGREGIVRYRGSMALDSILREGVDDWILVEAGLSLYPTADLDDDGVPDTGDNNEDGVVDAADIEKDEDSGPLKNPKDPSDPQDPRYIMTRVLPRSWPYGFSNPLIIDWDGDGWSPPGLAEGP